MKSSDYKDSVEGINSFFNSFGPLDEHSKIVLEVFFEELYAALSIPNQQKQERCEDTDNI